MKVITLILITAITIALSVTVTIKSTVGEEGKPQFDPIIESTPTTSSPDEPFPSHESAKIMPSKRVSRFLVEQSSAAPARTYGNMCLKNQVNCVSVDVKGHSKNSTCCNMRCVHLQSDRRNCGACGFVCSWPKVCCRGACVNLATDAKHCGRCHKVCAEGLACRYSMCDYP